jgi:F-type H+-transporting ATPase subunit delta
MSTNKSFSTETAERYSRALYEVVKESNEINKVENDLNNFLITLNSSFEIQNFIKDPSQSLNQQYKVIGTISDKLSFSKNLKNFFFLLIKKRRSELKGSLISSKELSKSELDDLSKDLSKSVGSNLKLNYKVDKELIGGLKLQLGSFMIDTSIKNKLKRYKQVLIEN